MKKYAVILCVILSLFLVACAEPDNNPGKQESRDIDFVVDVSVFGESLVKEITQIEFSYEIVAPSKAMSEPVRFNVPSDGLIPVGKIKVKKGDKIDYHVKAFNKENNELATISGTIAPKEGIDKISIEPEKDKPISNEIVIKVRNKDLPVGSQKISIDAQTFGAKYYTSWEMFVSKGDFTVIPLTDEFIEVFKTGGDY